MKPWLVPSNGIPADVTAKLHAQLPQLETARLLVRPARLVDYPVWDEIMKGPNGVFLGGPWDDRGAYLDFAQCVGSWFLRGFGLWAIEDQQSSKVLGFVAHGHEYGCLEAELGFLLIETAQGRGIATEAARAVRDYAFSVLKQPSLVLYFDPRNGASRAVALKLGATQDLAAETQAKGAAIYRLVPSDGGMEAYT
ncbi:MAG: GNAT family N-acetyltransferase [Dinoroseobacter sp.]|nr:GNAT family N-acetyltransferase [Dinoroseobacter sp.]